MSAYSSFLTHRDLAQRALGRYIVERLEVAARLPLVDTGLPSLFQNGDLSRPPNGTDMQVSALIALSGVAHGRKVSAMQAWRTATHQAGERSSPVDNPASPIDALPATC